jgi:arsenate reductase
MPTRVLFLCTGNSARSQMAEAFLRKYAGDCFEAHSAGLEPRGVNPLTVQVMQEVGIDISGQSSKGVDTYLGKVLFQYLITVCDDAEKIVPPSGRALISVCTGPSKTRQPLKAQSMRN